MPKEAVAYKEDIIPPYYDRFLDEREKRFVVEIQRLEDLIKNGIQQINQRIDGFERRVEERINGLDERVLIELRVKLTITFIGELAYLCH